MMEESIIESVKKSAPDVDPSASYMDSSARISYVPMPRKKLDCAFEDAANLMPPPACVQEKNETFQVFLRLRPTDGRYSVDEGRSTVQVGSDQRTIKTTQPAATAARAKLKAKQVVKQFSFSQVFKEDTTQLQFYQGAMKPIVHSLCSGQNVLLFSYGMTNAGKTYTILGDKKNPGVVPQLLEDLYANGNGFKSIKVSCLEIYNELVHDLLRKATRAKRPALKLQDCGGVVEVKGLTSAEVKSVDEAMNLIKQAAGNRSTAGTNMNVTSSRSHCVTTFEMKKVGAQAPVILWVVDLAGSERGDRTGVSSTGQRQREASKINTSLMKLWRCLKQMRRMQGTKNADTQNTYFVPFRESKLTHLLMNHLSGAVSGRTIMIVNSSVAAADYDETQHVLEHSALAQELVVVKNEERHAKHTRKQRVTTQYDKNGRRIRKRKADSSSEELKIANSSINCPKTEAESSNVTPEDEINSLKGLNLTLQKSVEQLQQNLAKQEAEIRMEVAKEMAERMDEMQQQFNRSFVDEGFANQPSMCTSSRKVKVGALQSYINELEERNQECEDEIARMRNVYEDKIQHLTDKIKMLEDQQSQNKVHGQAHSDVNIVDLTVSPLTEIDFSESPQSELLRLRKENEFLKAQLSKERDVTVPKSAGSVQTDEFQQEFQQRKERDAIFKRMKQSPRPENDSVFSPGGKTKDVLKKMMNVLSRAPSPATARFPLSPRASNLNDQTFQLKTKPLLFHPGRSDKENNLSASTVAHRTRSHHQTQRV